MANAIHRQSEDGSHGIPNSAVKFTYQDDLYASEATRCELFDGELVTVSTPGELHQSVSAQLGWRMVRFASENNPGRIYHAPLDVVLSDGVVVQTDLLFVSKGRSHIITPENIQGATDLVVEILPPSTATRDRTFKRTLYARHGVKEYWMVDTTAKDITVLLHGDRGFEVVDVYGEGEAMTSPTLRGFRISLEDIFLAA